MSLSAQKCCVPGCMESGNSHTTLHLFPNPNKDRERFNIWVFSVMGDIIGSPNEEVYKLRRVCHAHFEEKYCCRYNRISNIAVPTLNLPKSLVFSKSTCVERRPLRQPILSTSDSSADPQMEISLNASIEECERKNTENIGPLTLPKNTYKRVPMRHIQLGTEPLPTTSASSAGLQMELPNIKSLDNMMYASVKENIDPAVMQPPHSLEPKKEKHSVKKIYKGCYKGKTCKKNLTVTRAEQLLYNKLMQARIKLSKCRNKRKQQSASLKAAKNLASNVSFLATIENFSSAAKNFTLMQFREYKKKIKGRRFTLNEKILALSILKQAPKGYRFLRKMFILPAPQTLAKLIRHANVEPGINKKIFLQLRNKTDSMKMEEKLCILLFDEMYLKASLSYNEAKDKAVGFVTDGQETKQDFADHAQVFMIRGLIKNYKQPVSYSFSAAATSGQQIAKQVKEVIKELQDAGLIVVATVCDQGANNRNAIKLLLQETRGLSIRKGHEPKDNIIVINDNEIIPLYDPPHLLKCVRNNLMTKNLEYSVNGLKKIAKWEHIQSLHKENPGYKGVRLIPKLTDGHVVPNKISKMKVKFASQVFSRTVATNMGYLADKNILPKECSETADILLLFDNLFDSQNGSQNKKQIAYGKPLLGAVTPNSVHHTTWAEAVKTLKQMKFVNSKTGKYESVPTLNNWAWTLEGTEVLLKKLVRDYNVTSVWMRHLNQDPIENFFGAIRSHGCRNTNPTPEKFESAFTTLLINNMSSVHAIGGNCENDFCENLHALIVTGDNDCEAASTCDLTYLPEIVVDDIAKKSDPRIMGALQYVSGYFIRNVKKIIFKGCKQCADNVIASEGVEYIKYREYAGRNWLCSPSESVVKCISAIQDITNTLIKECVEKKYLKELTKTHILMFVEFDFLDCREHKEQIINYLINICFRFFIFHYCKDINKILTGKRQINDDEDKIQMKAKKYFTKCYKRPIK